MQAMFLLLLKGFAKATLTKHFIIWALKMYAKFSKNKVDDNVVLIVEGSLSSDVEKIKKGVEGLLTHLSKGEYP